MLPWIVEEQAVAVEEQNEIHLVVPKPPEQSGPYCNSRHDVEFGFVGSILSKLSWKRARAVRDFQVSKRAIHESPHSSKCSDDPTHSKPTKPDPTLYTTIVHANNFILL